MRLHLALLDWVATTAAKATAKTGAERDRFDRLLAAQVIPLKRIDKHIDKHIDKRINERTDKTRSLVYTSAIARHLAAQPQQAATIAAQLADIVVSKTLPDEPFNGITVQATVAGLIHFEVGDRAIAAWLDQLLLHVRCPTALPSVPMAEPERQLLLQSTAIFEAQYAHARCCSLLRLAHREALIRLDNLEASPFYWRFSSPLPLPWLTTSTQLALHHPADRGLLVQLFEGYDRLSQRSPQRTPAALARTAQAVSQTFQVFHQTHPLWAGTEKEPALIATRLGLLMATQRVLYLLLADGLALFPAIEL